MSDKATIASLQRTVAEQAAEVLRLRALLVSCDERLDELGCGACYVPPTAPVEAVPEAVGEAMTTLRTALARLRVERQRLVEAAVRAAIEEAALEAGDYVEDADLCGVPCRDEVSAIDVHLRHMDPAPVVARVLGGRHD